MILVLPVQYTKIDFMKELQGKELEEGMKFIKEAVRASKKSPCKKSQRGAVLVKNGKIISIGYNGAPKDKVCDPCLRENIKDNSRTELCHAIHAEQRAILNALRKGYDLTDSRLYHIKVKNNKTIPTDDISCTLCSRLILESGVSEMALLHTYGLFVYDAEEYNNLNFDYFLK
jgi:dCMP deaminase